jgi:hypothetical protein
MQQPARFSQDRFPETAGLIQILDSNAGVINLVDFQFISPGKMSSNVRIQGPLDEPAA